MKGILQAKKVNHLQNLSYHTAIKSRFMRFVSDNRRQEQAINSSLKKKNRRIVRKVVGF